MQSPDGTRAADNVQARWRMAVARQAAQVYAENRGLAAMAVAGSVGAGLADQFSDLELDCYWLRPPADEERLAPVRALAGSHCDADLTDFREMLSERRRAIGPPPA